MVQAIINIGEKENRILTIIRGKHGLKNKSEAINFLIENYEKNLLEPELRPEYKEELLKIDKGKFHELKDIKSLKELIENV
ncbi:DUF2683 family protein [Candidatus Woesearchaeota archaeon]|nr:DUF2683 family protein [Candidatus Woesearchaeota archaeon]